ncbi:MAG: hypothetical protein NZ483_11075 [Verrucomicrobiae bacterium]|nr:hypothetical protein [Verrucomicrobiae bacterium]
MFVRPAPLAFRTAEKNFRALAAGLLERRKNFSARMLFQKKIFSVGRFFLAT